VERMSQLSDSRGSSTDAGSNNFLLDGKASESGDASGDDIGLAKGDVESWDGGGRVAIMEYEAAAVASSGSSTNARFSFFLGATRGKKGFEGDDWIGEVGIELR
jgi:hypothetical protein